ncbi:hypothetical protein SNE40_011228 [Patella caerulea]|uniref:EGF-like domain-containing protein n=2 Tax=Patella caerulea TaxID=87958 RepID=A0AAN8PTN7_PATCE
MVLPESFSNYQYRGKLSKKKNYLKQFHGLLHTKTLLLQLSLIFFISLIFLGPCEGAKLYKCSVCKTIADDFFKGMKETAKSNYGGGNTNWEEKSLGSYAKSEIRLVEVMEYLCKGGDKECHHMLEEHEELIETFWYKEFGKNNNIDLHSWLCIENIKACCPGNTFGPECSPCLGGMERPCAGNGDCDGGGTRQGKGTCSCHSGYTGELCNECSDGYFEEMKNDTHTVCNKCHESCKLTCWESGPQGCDECKDGYEIIDETCMDVDECKVDGNNPCDENRMCVNNEGSYSCTDIPQDENHKDTDDDADSEDENKSDTEVDDKGSDNENKETYSNDKTVLTNEKEEL